MKNFTSILLLASLAAYAQARGGRTGDVSAAYANYMAQFGKSPTTTDEQLRRQINYNNASSAIEEVNRKAATSGGATARHNHLSDMDSDEKDRILGRQDNGVRNSLPMSDGRHQLGDSHMSIDHGADGRMHAIKNQGSCGSCWAFGAMTALEGALAIKGDYRNPARISEQEGVDCTNYNTTTKFGKDYGNGGCNGGLEYFHWNFCKDHGCMTDEEYPYTGRDDACDRDVVDSRTTVNNIIGWQREEQSVAAMIDRLQSTPIAIGIHASCSAFMYYDSGIITLDQCPPSGMDHSIVIIGYASGEDDGNDDGDNDNDDGDNDDGDEDTPTPITSCKQTKWWYTCDESAVQSTRSSGERYWKAQNSWGTGWGENGYVRIEMAEGQGVGCTNCDATSPQLA